MAKEILVREILSNEMINAGLKIIERLDTENAQLTSAFWLYNEEDRGWKLILASPLVTDLGPREYYRKVINANNLASEDEEILSTHDIAVTNTADKIVQLLKCAIKSEGISGIRFSRNAINGSFIEDAYIYRSN
jgi:hypothetical protein